MNHESMMVDYTARMPSAPLLNSSHGDKVCRVVFSFYTLNCTHIYCLVVQHELDNENVSVLVLRKR